MKLQENIQRVKQLMGLNESRKPIFNLDLIEWGPPEEGTPEYDRMVKRDQDNIDDRYRSWGDREREMNKLKYGEPKKIDKKDDFSESVVKDVVWRAGQLKLDPRSGGLWFGDSKDGVEKFALSVRKEKREGKPYYINLKNPYFMEDGFWRGYVNSVDSPNGRETLMLKLMGQGYDGIIINDDTWNDTGDEYSVYGKQYVVFDEDDVKPV